MEPENNGETSKMPAHKEGSVGPVIGTIIILAVILLGGLYFWGNRSEIRNANIEGQTQSELEAIETQSDSDDLDSIDSDLDATQYDFNSEMNAS
ncbi:MAG: hypothetical protein M3Q24_00055 [bacterium]|nr:hypothetical protein [bacterium]